MTRRITGLGLAALAAFALAGTPALAGHHEKGEAAAKEAMDKGKHAGHEKQPEHAKGDERSGQRGAKGHENHDHHAEHEKGRKK